MSAAGLTDSASREAEKLLNAAMTPDQFKAAVETMKADMQNVSVSFDASLGDIKNNMMMTGLDYADVDESAGYGSFDTNYGSDGGVTGPGTSLDDIWA